MVEGIAKTHPRAVPSIFVTTRPVMPTYFIHTFCKIVKVAVVIVVVVVVVGVVIIIVEVIVVRSSSSSGGGSSSSNSK